MKLQLYQEQVFNLIGAECDKSPYRTLLHLSHSSIVQYTLLLCNSVLFIYHYVSFPQKILYSLHIFLFENKFMFFWVVSNIHSSNATNCTIYKLWSDNFQPKKNFQTIQDGPSLESSSC